MCGQVTQKHIRIQSDNTTAVSYINAMGGIKSKPCNDIAVDIWNWCSSRNIWLSACHIPGVKNTEADKESKCQNESTEWSLTLEVFEDINKLWGTFDIDLFVSRLSFEVPSYTAWKPDPMASFVDALLMDWKLQKIETDRAKEVIIVPLWRTQPWFTVLLHPLVEEPRLLPQSNKLLVQPHSDVLHPLRNQMRLIACKVSGIA